MVNFKLFKSWVFESFISAALVDLRSFLTWASVRNSWYWKISSNHVGWKSHSYTWTIFRFLFNLLISESDDVTITLLYWVILYYITQITLTVPCEESRIVFFDYSIMKNIVVFPTPFKLVGRRNFCLYSLRCNLLFQFQRKVSCMTCPIHIVLKRQHKPSIYAKETRVNEIVQILTLCLGLLP